MPSTRVVLITHPVRGARAFAAALVDAELAACVNLVAVGSVYRWQGRVEEARETLLVVKSSRARLAELERFVAGRHPYECPEFVVLTPEHVEPRYQAWLAAGTGARRRRAARR